MAINLLSLTCYEMYPLLYKPVGLQKLTLFREICRNILNFVNCVQNGLLFFGYFDGRMRVGERVAKRGIVTRIVGERSQLRRILAQALGT